MLWRWIRLTLSFLTEIFTGFHQLVKLCRHGDGNLQGKHVKERFNEGHMTINNSWTWTTQDYPSPPHFSD